MTSPLPTPLSRSERALEILDKLRAAIEAENPNDATDHLGKLDTLLKEWRRETNIEAAKTYLDAAFTRDVLVFNSETARKHLKQWTNALEDPDDESLAQYKSRVDEFIEKKEWTLKVRGVIAHCGELLAQANTLEHSETPPKPDFLLTNHYNKAVDIAASALAEYPLDADLDALLQQTENQRTAKVTASRIYTLALEQHNYNQAIGDLDSLAEDSLIPRFVLSKDEAGNTKLRFHSMIPHAQAQEELAQLAKQWAEKQATKALQQAQLQLEAHNPQAALDALENQSDYLPWLTDTVIKQLNKTQTQAETDLTNLQQAEEQAQSAIELAASSSTSEEAINAWNMYAHAYGLYQWANSLTAARTAVLDALETRLNGQISEAEQAFNNRDMEGVRAIYKNAQPIFSQKDPRLDALMERLAELNDITHQYDEYMQNAAETLEQVKSMLWQDTAAANDLLTQLESYPDLILESFSEVHDLRVKVNERLNADSAYNHIVTALHTDDVNEVKVAIKAVKEAAEEFADDNRFPNLAHALELHHSFLNARNYHAAGDMEKARALLQPVAALPNHPDQPKAVEMLAAMDVQADS